jgi:hypothetical protein
MPRDAAHVSIANRNEATIRYLLQDKNSHAEWIATVAFYRALHIAEAMLATKGRHTQDHGDRHDELKRSYPALWHSYRLLWAMSMIARYMREPGDARPGMGFGSFSDYLGGRDVEDVVIRDCLRPFEQQAKLKLAGPSAKALNIT